MSAKKKKKGQSRKPKKPTQSQPVQPIEGKAEVVVEAEDKAGNGMAGMIKALIIVSTFVAIALLSVFSQGPDSTGPGIGVVAIRFSLLSVCATVYFLMLYLTRLSRQKSEQKPADAKK
jgi:hypothetical protein